MAKSNAERQATYRERHLVDVDGAGSRINVVVSVQTKAQLARLAIRYGVTQRAMLEKMIAATERQALRRIKPGDQSAYFDGVTP